MILDIVIKILSIYVYMNTNKQTFMYIHGSTATLTTCSEPCHRRRAVPVRRVARPQLPVFVVAPAVGAAARHQGARVGVSRGEGDDACGERRGRRRRARRGCVERKQRETEREDLLCLLEQPERMLTKLAQR